MNVLGIVTDVFIAEKILNNFMTQTNFFYACCWLFQPFLQ